MISKLIGLTELDFPERDENGKDSGNRIQGIKLCFTCPDPNWLGSGVSMPFIRKGTELYNKIKGHELEYVNKKIDVEYVPNIKGRATLVNIELVKE